MNPLEQLKDIHLPQEVGLWPLAWGWWVLIVLVLASLSYTMVWAIKRHQKRLAMRQTIKSLESLQNTNSDWPQQINSLLKRAAMVYFPTGSVEGLHSHAWVEFLVRHLPQSKQKEAKSCFTDLQNSLYSNHPIHTEFDKLQNQAVAWVKQALPPSKQQLQGVEHV